MKYNTNKPIQTQLDKLKRLQRQIGLEIDDIEFTLENSSLFLMRETGLVVCDLESEDEVDHLLMDWKEIWGNIFDDGGWLNRELMCQMVRDMTDHLNDWEKKKENPSHLDELEHKFKLATLKWKAGHEA